TGAGRGRTGPSRSPSRKGKSPETTTSALFMPSPRLTRSQRGGELPSEPDSLHCQSCLELRRRHPDGTQGGILRSGYLTRVTTPRVSSASVVYHDSKRRNSQKKWLPAVPPSGT